MSNEWAHDAARKGVPTEMNNLIHAGHVLADPDGRAQAGSAGTYLRCAETAQLVQDRGIFVPTFGRATADDAPEEPVHDPWCRYQWHLCGSA